MPPDQAADGSPAPAVSEAGYGPDPRVRPPFAWLVGAFAAAAASLALLLVSGPPWGSGFGWLLAAVVSVTLVALFTQADLTRQLNVWYLPSRAARASTVLALVAAVVLMGFHAWDWATWFARR